MPKVSTKQVQRRIAELDAHYTRPKRPGGFTALRSVAALIILDRYRDRPQWHRVARGTAASVLYLVLSEGLRRKS
jgi:hypothetical protein